MIRSVLILSVLGVNNPFDNFWVFVTSDDLYLHAGLFLLCSIIVVVSKGAGNWVKGQCYTHYVQQSSSYYNTIQKVIENFCRFTIPSRIHCHNWPRMKLHLCVFVTKSSNCDNRDSLTAGGSSAKIYVCCVLRSLSHPTAVILLIMELQQPIEPGSS